MFKTVALSFTIPVGAVAGYCYTVSRRDQSEKLHVTLDLDHTLLQSFRKKNMANTNNTNLRKHDFEILDEDRTYLVWVRPFCVPTLWFLSKMFNVHMFTAASKDYGEAMIEQLPKRFLKTYYVDSCHVKGSHGKDISIITKEKNILIDDQLRNRTLEQEFYHIPMYYRFMRFDFELPKLCAWLVMWQLQHDLKV